MTINWAFLRDLCAEADVGDEFHEFEGTLGTRFLAIILDATDTRKRYYADEMFARQLDRLIGVIVFALTGGIPRRSPPPAPDMEKLTQVFKEEAGIDEIPT